jgi:hypothetical protein
MLTVASIVMGAVSALIAFRNNFGWKPLVLVTSNGYNLSLELEIWNRRKYPIVVRNIQIQFNAIKLRDTVLDDPWTLFRNSLMRTRNLTIAPSSYHALSIVAPMKEGTRLDDATDRLEIRVYYFDPRYSKERTIRLTEDFKLT